MDKQKLLNDLYLELFETCQPKSYPCKCPPADEITRIGPKGIEVIGAIPHYSCVYCRLQKEASSTPKV